MSRKYVKRYYPMKRIWLFLKIVFRDFHGVRIWPRLGWEVSGIVCGRSRREEVRQYKQRVKAIQEADR